MNQPTLARTLLRIAIAGMALAAAFAHAQTYPTKPLKMIVPQAPGGGTDALGRQIAQRLSEVLGQSVIVENKPGADGIVGTDLAAKSPADGYTLLMTSASHAVNPSMYAKLPFDTTKDISCVTQTAAQQVVLLVHPSLPVHNVRELIAYAKANPDKLSFGSPSSASRLPMELFNSMAGLKMTSIPYKGTAPALNDMLAGRVPVGFTGAAAVMSHVKSGALRALAIGDDRRSVLFPDLPTVSESGLPGFQTTLWSVLTAPSGTPKPIVERLRNELAKAFAEPGFKDKLLAAGFEPVGSTPEQCDAFIAKEAAKWAKVVKDAGMKAE